MSGLFARAGDVLTGARGCLFALHRCAPAADWAALPNRGFYMDADYLDTLLGYLARTGWAVVTMEDGLARAAEGRGRWVNFSVDDGYRDTVERIVPIFRRRRAPVTLFITTGIPDGTLPVWQAGLETIIAEQARLLMPEGSRPVQTAAEKRRAYAEISAAWDRDSGAHYQDFCVRHGYDRALLRERHAITWSMLETVRDDPFVEIGAHTISHPHVAALPPDQAAHEISGSGARIRERLGVPCRHFAFPFGQRVDCGDRDSALAQASGFASAATTQKGLLRPGVDPFRVPRNILNGQHRNTLLAEAHLLGVTGMAARMLGHG